MLLEELGDLLQGQGTLDRVEREVNDLALPCGQVVFSHSVSYASVPSNPAWGRPTAEARRPGSLRRVSPVRSTLIRATSSAVGYRIAVYLTCPRACPGRPRTSPWPDRSCPSRSLPALDRRGNRGSGPRPRH